MECIIDGTLLNRAHNAVFNRHLEVSTVIALFPNHWMVTCGTIAIFGEADYDGPGITLRPESMYPTWPTFPKGPVTLTEDGFRWQEGVQRFPMARWQALFAGKIYDTLTMSEILGKVSKTEIRKQLEEISTQMINSTYQQRIPLYGEVFEGQLLKGVLPLLEKEFFVSKTSNPNAFLFHGKNVQVVVCRLLPPPDKTTQP